MSINNQVRSQSPLFDAASMGQADLVRKYIKEGWDIDVVDSTGRTPLSYARNFESAQVLIKAGCEMELPANRKMALLKAATYGAPKHVRLLLDHGCQIESRDRNQRTPLILAAHENSAEVVRLLCDRGAQLNAQDKYGHTALSWAAWTGSLDSIKVLLEAGAKIDLADSDGRPPLFFASNRSPEKVRLLLQKGANTQPLKWNRLMRAAATQDVKELKSSLPKADFDAQDLAKRTALHLAAYLGNPEIIKLLVSAGAKIDSLDRDQRTPLHLAALHGKAENIKVLIDSGADPNRLDRRGVPPLSICTDATAAEALLVGGAKVDEKGKIPFSPLFASFGYVTLNGRQPGRLDVTKILVKHGADVHQTFDQPFGATGVTTLMYACEFSTPETVEYLLKQGAPVDSKDSRGETSIHYAARGSSPKTIQLLVDQGADLEARNDKGATALFQATRYDSLEHLETLIEAGAELNAVLKNKATLLHEARTPQVISFLVKQGIDPNLRDAYGESAIFSAAAYGSYITLDSLLQNGCDVNLVNNHGVTPLAGAITHGQVEQVQLLLKHGAKITLEDPNVFDLAKKIDDRSARDRIIELLQQSLKK